MEIVMWGLFTAFLIVWCSLTILLHEVWFNMWAYSNRPHWAAGGALIILFVGLLIVAGGMAILATRGGELLAAVIIYLVVYLAVLVNSDRIVRWIEAR